MIINFNHQSHTISSVPNVGSKEQWDRKEKTCLFHIAHVPAGSTPGTPVATRSSLDKLNKRTRTGIDRRDWLGLNNREDRQYVGAQTKPESIMYPGCHPLVIWWRNTTRHETCAFATVVWKFYEAGEAGLSKGTENLWILCWLFDFSVFY